LRLRALTSDDRATNQAAADDSAFVIDCQHLSLSTPAACCTLARMKPTSVNRSVVSENGLALDPRREPDPGLEATWAELAARSIGRISLNDARDVVTKTLLMAALEQSNDNYSRAARLLGVTRQAVQYLVHRHDAHTLRVPRVG